MGSPSIRPFPAAVAGHYFVITLFVSLLIAVGVVMPWPVHAVDECALTFFSEAYMRTVKARADVYTKANITMPAAVKAPYWLKVTNGTATGSDRVSAYQVDLNGVTIVQSSDVPSRLSATQKPVSLIRSNTLTVTLSGDTAGYVTVELSGQKATNRSPVAVSDAYSVDASTTLHLPAPGVLHGDRDPDGNPLEAYLRTPPAQGALRLRGDGSFSYTPHPNVQGTDTFTYQAFDGCVFSNTAKVTLSITPLPPDPTTVAPPADPTVVTTLASATAFLFSGPDPIQLGVSGDAIDPMRASVLRGRVRARDGTALPDVRISVLHHPAFGHTKTRLDGLFDLAVNGGGTLTLQYAKEGYLPAQRHVEAPWQDYAWLPEVAMIPVDPHVTPIDLANATSLQVARGTPVTDQDGTRQATLLFPPGTQAEMLRPDKQTVPLPTIHVRATEFSVGATGPAAMPAELPPQSGYTYAVEYSLDEALTAGATGVRFSTPVISYVENFLNFPVGTPVPAGYYDRQQGQWLASDNGRVLKILTMAAGLAQVDTDGDGLPDAGADIGLTAAERQFLAAQYSPGQSLWRVPITHFSPWDFNWPYGPPDDAVAPTQPDPRLDRHVEDPDCQAGSVIECQRQTLKEVVPVVGAPFSLHYSSDRTPGRTSLYTMDIFLSQPPPPVAQSSSSFGPPALRRGVSSGAGVSQGAVVPKSAQGITLDITVAGRQFHYAFLPKEDLTQTFTWDGLDAYGRVLQGAQPVHVSLSYRYPALYQTPQKLARSFATFSGVPMQANPARRDVTLRQDRSLFLGTWDARAQGLGGWTPSIHHVYDPVRQTLYLGTGEQRTAQAIGHRLITIGGNGIALPGADGVPATKTSINGPRGIAAAPDGTIFVAEYYGDRVRRIRPDGIIDTVAGGGTCQDPCEGVPATSVRLYRPWDVAVAPDGSLYISDHGIHRVRRVAPDGLITTVAGTGSPNYGGEGVPAAQAPLYAPTYLALGPDGSLYIAESGNRLIRRVAPDGTMTTVAGPGGSNMLGDGGPATSAFLYAITGLHVDATGALYLADQFTHLVRRVGTDGIITTVAGNRTGPGYPQEGVIATVTPVDDPFGVATGPDGTLYLAIGFSSGWYGAAGGRIYRVGSDGIISTLAGGGTTLGEGSLATAAKLADVWDVTVRPDSSVCVSGSHLIRCIVPSLPGLQTHDIAIPSEDGRDVYVFDQTGRHQRTVNAVTGSPIYQFFYDANGHVTSIVDGDGNVTTLERDSQGRVTAIVSPDSQRTIVSVNGDGDLESLTNPAGERTAFSYRAGGLLETLTNAKGYTYTFTYDDKGRLVRDDDPTRGFTTLARTDLPAGHTVTLTTALGRSTSYRLEQFRDRNQRRVNTYPDGTSLTETLSANGNTTATWPDGTTTTLTKGPDPRFGMAAPLLSLSTVQTPAGLAWTTSASRAVALSDPNDPWSLASSTDTVTVNGQTYTTTYSASTHTFIRTTPEARVSSATIDLQGRIVQEQVPGVEPITYSYDTRGRLDSVTQGTGAAARTATFTYDGHGNLETLTDALTRQTRWGYDDAGRVKEHILPDGKTIVYTYDQNGNVASITPPGRPAHTLTYTPVDLTREYLPPPPRPPVPTPQTVYDYNVDRQLTKVTRPDGQVLTLDYDRAGRASTLTTPISEYRYAYDGAGRLASLALSSPRAPSTTLAYTYDGFLPLSTTWSGPINASVGRAFDTNFRISAQTINGRDSVDYAYDKDGLLARVGQLTLIRKPQNGLLESTTLGAVTDTWTYNAFGEPETYAAFVNGVPMLAVTYLYDRLGRIAQTIETMDGITTTFEYAYDPGGRLHDVKKNGSVVSTYSYDANGNRDSRVTPAGTTLGTFDDQDLMRSYGANTYTYTANGELASKTAGGLTTTYDYDGLGNLRKVVLPGGPTVEYVIDGQNRRVGTRVNGPLVQGWVYDGQLQIVAELDGSGNVVSRYVYGERSNVPSYIVKGGVTYRLIADHLGSPRLVIDVATGQIVQRLDYDEFGNVLQDTKPGFQPFGFAGGLYDRDTELVRFGARDYDPRIGRWAAKDPILFARGDTNLYRYVWNDPVNWVDRSGLAPEDPFGLQGVVPEVAAFLAAVGGVAVAVEQPYGSAGVVALFSVKAGATAFGTAAGGIAGALYIGYEVGRAIEALTGASDYLSDAAVSVERFVRRVRRSCQ